MERHKDSQEVYLNACLNCQDYNEYFSDHTDNDSLAYLTLANLLIHTINPVLINNLTF